MNMEKNRAIPQGYMTVGEAAKKMGVTVRTLQYYDKEGLFSPSAESEGGRRLYTDKDLITLHQILSLKSLGFSLEDIRRRLPSLETPADVANVLTEQADEMRREIERLTESLTAIQQLRAEVLQMQTVDFKKYADIIANLQMKNEFYFLIKHFDDAMLDHIRRKFDEESGKAFINRFSALNKRILKLKESGVPQDSEACQKAAEEFWKMVMEFTDGDMSMLPKLMEFGQTGGGQQDEWQKDQAAVNEYIGPALELYFSRTGMNPFGGTGGGNGSESCDHC